MREIIERVVVARTWCKAMHFFFFFRKSTECIVVRKHCFIQLITLAVCCYTLPITWVKYFMLEYVLMWFISETSQLYHPLSSTRSGRLGFRETIKLTKNNRLCLTPRILSFHTGYRAKPNITHTVRA